MSYVCDSCDKERPGQPYRTSRDGEYEHGLKFCFPCVKTGEREQEREQREAGHP